MLIITPKIDLDSERWFSPVDGLQLLVLSSEAPQYRSRNSLIRRHIDKLDESYQVGTTSFDITKVGDIDSIDDLLIDNCAKYLLKDWKGVGEMIEGKESSLEYTPERGAALLKQHPDIYWQVINEASAIA